MAADPRPESTSAQRLPAAAAVLRRSLLVWGLGHLALGDRRGWLLLLLQPLALGAVAGVSVLLLDTTRWIVVFPCLTLLIALWLGQAIHAHQRALALGAQSGGELQLAWAMPIVVAVLTAFWLFGGDHGSPAATLQEYVAAWHAGRSEEARALFVDPPAAAELAAAWQAQDDYVSQRVGQAALMYGPASGLDPESPLAGLRYIEVESAGSPDTAMVAVEIVRRQRVETALFGLIPTATQETVLVERAGVVRLRAVPTRWPAWLPGSQAPPHAWRIEAVDLPVRAQTVQP
ncbi:MAG TPA: hypothetical protein VMP67_10285 [Candidatus Limnocylindria bacterium]|nr:hypothetical protein [Candidatus Limnocylindria bacterium]